MKKIISLISFILLFNLISLNSFAVINESGSGGFTSDYKKNMEKTFEKMIKSIKKNLKIIAYASTSPSGCQIHLENK